MTKHIWVSGQRLHQLQERYPYLKNLEWFGTIPPVYTFHIFENSDNTAGIVACSDAFGGGVAWARYVGENTIVGAESEGLDKEERSFLAQRYPEFLHSVETL